MATDKEIIDSLKTDWLPSDYYNFEDLNRVEQATQVVRGRVAVFRGQLVTLEPIKTNRNTKTIEFADSLNRLETNIYRLIITFPETMSFREPKTNWTHDQPFDFSDAIRLEKNLYDMYYLIENNISNIPYCGTVIAGERGVL
jgi:hypothetical protein